MNETAERAPTREADLPRAAGRAPAWALIEEARHRRRRRWLATGIMTALLLAAAAVLAAVLVGPGRAPGGQPSPMRRQPTALPVMPPLIVAWTGNSRIEVLSARTGRVIRTLVKRVAEIRGLPHLALSASGTLFFDDAQGTRERVRAVPVSGGPVTTVATDAALPAVSPDGHRLAYVTGTEGGSAPEAIVVRDLITGTRRSWAIAARGPDILALAWSPDGRHLSFTQASSQLGLAFPAARSWVLDTHQPSGSLAGARRIPLHGRVSWAGYLTERTGVGVLEAPHWTALVRVNVATGRVIGPLTTLPEALFTANTADGPEGSVQVNPTGHYFLIAAAGTTGRGQIFGWTPGMPHPVPIASGAIRAIWARAGRE